MIRMIHPAWGHIFINFIINFINFIFQNLATIITSKYKDFESKATIRKIQAIMRSYLASKKKHDNLIEKAKNLKLINSNTGKLNQETGVGNLNTLQDAHGM